MYKISSYYVNNPTPNDDAPTHHRSVWVSHRYRLMVFHNEKENFMKKLSILALSLSATVAITPAFAETTTHYNTPSVTAQPTTLDVVSQQVAPTATQADLSFAFDDVENVQALAMTDGEMAETQGAILPFVAATLVGGATSAWFNHGVSYVRTGRPASVKSTLVATGTGMVSRGYSSAMLRGVGSAGAVTKTVIKGNGYAVSQGTVGIYNRGRR